MRDHTNARRFGIPYFRASRLEVPGSLTVDGREIRLFHNGDSGVEADFFECFIRDAYCLRAIKRRGIRKILDIGGNQGFFSLSARSWFPEACIEICEPNAELRDILDANARQIGATVHYCAVGSSYGHVRLTSHAASNQRRTEPFKSCASAIRQISIDSLIEEHGGSIDLIKMDCEGAEWDILSSERVWTGFRFLTMEYHLWAAHPRSHEFLERLLGSEYMVHAFLQGNGTGYILVERKGA